MTESILFILSVFFIFIFTKVCERNKFFVDFKKEKHKRFVSKTNNYSIGGIIFFLFCLFIFFTDNYFNPLFWVFFSLIFFLGLFSDLKIFKSPKLRFLLQLTILIFFVLVVDFKIPLSKIEFIDFFLSNLYFNKLFTIFCLMILLNGNNFVDGINTLLIGYNIILTAFLLITLSELLPKKDILIDYLIILFALLIFNLNGKIILGDAGAYALAFFLGVFLIEFASFNPYLSPFFVISIIWYPCFELLFSIIRRLNYLKKTYEPDTIHLHQLLYKYYSKKIKNNYLTHLTVSSIINGFFIISLIINKAYGYKSSVIVIFLIINITSYLILYNFLKKKIKD